VNKISHNSNQCELLHSKSKAEYSPYKNLSRYFANITSIRLAKIVGNSIFILALSYKYYL